MPDITNLLDKNPNATHNILGYSVKDKTKIKRIGKGTETDPYRPDTDEKYWQKVGEITSEYNIEILEE